MLVSGVLGQSDELLLLVASWHKPSASRPNRDFVGSFLCGVKSKLMAFISIVEGVVAGSFVSRLKLIP